MTTARVVLTQYANRVLNVVKAKYDLNDKSQALNKFIELYGEEEVEHKVKDSFVKKILKQEEEYFKRHKGGFSTQTVEELRKEIEGEGFKKNKKLSLDQMKKELGLVAKKLKKEKSEMKRKGTKYLTEKEALSKYTR